MKKKLIKKSDILTFLLIFILTTGSIGILLLSYFNQHIVSNNQILGIIGKAFLTIDFGNGQKRFFEGDIVDDETFVDIFNKASIAGKFSYVFDGKNSIVSVNGTNNGNEKSWHLYINDKNIDELLSKIIIKNYDKVFVKYE